MSCPDHHAAFRAERADLLAFCDSLGPADWRMNSRAAGWSVKDVVAHLAAGCHALFSPAAVALMRGDDIERTNDELVDRRRDRSATEVIAEYRRWSRVFAGSIPMLTGTPLNRVRIPLAELGRFPLRLVPAAMVFDHHTHLRHDMAPVLGRTAPPSDPNRIAVITEWMTAVLSNQLRAARPGWLDRPVELTLSGPGGGTWRVETTGEVVPGLGVPAATQITAAAVEFPEWGTRRASWRDRDVTITGDGEYGARFLDAVTIV